LKAGVNDVVELLLHARCSASEVNPKGVSLLHMAVFQGNLPMCKRLMEEKAHPNMYDKHEQTPLFFAPTPAVCTLLLNRGADLTIVNAKKQSAIHLAARAGNEGVLIWFIKHVSREILDLLDEHGATATYYARSAGVRHAVINSLYLMEPGSSMSEKELKEMKAHRAWERIEDRAKAPIVSHIVHKVERHLVSASEEEARAGDKGTTPDHFLHKRSASAGANVGARRGRSGKGKGKRAKRIKPEMFKLSDDEGGSTLGGRSPYGWEADTPGNSPGASNGVDVVKERAKIRKEVEHDMRIEMSRIEKEKNTLRKETDKVKKQVDDIGRIKEQAAKSKTYLKELERLRSQNQDLLRKHKTSQIEAKKMKHRHDKMSKTVKDHDQIRLEAATKIQRIFRSYKLVRLAARAKRKAEKELRRQQGYIDRGESPPITPSPVRAEGRDQSPRAQGKGNEKGRKVNKEKDMTERESRADMIRAQQDTLAAEKIQQTYRRSVCMRQLQEAPTEGAWALCKALRNQQGVRDFRAQEERKVVKEQVRRKDAYRGSIADKILEFEDKSYAMKKQSEQLERVLGWECLVGRLLANLSSSRFGLTRSWMIDFTQDEKDKEEQIAVAEAKAKAKSIAGGPTERRKKSEKQDMAVADLSTLLREAEADWDVGNELLDAARQSRQEKLEPDDAERYRQAHKVKVDQELAKFERARALADPIMAAKLKAQEDLAAAKIQARFRGNQDRRRVNDMRKTKEEEAAATKIQARFRGNKGRKAVATTKKKARQIKRSGRKKSSSPSKRTIVRGQ